ncbi:MAG: nucleotidyltransferase domain-containing protein [Bacilli bacterium]|nr:nucleotidyltransferase domain-containing protein [Bacilli bacterium]
MFEQLIVELQKNEEILAIALGGSRARGTYDEHSDYDLYIYTEERYISLDKRKELLAPFVSYMEYNNHFWELEDDGILKNGVEIEFIYRTFKDFFEMVDPLPVGHGYSTCFADNIISSVILYDRKGMYQDLVNKVQSQLTPSYFDKIINYNLPILSEKMPSLYHQVEKAIDRKDLHSINHRITAFFEVFYDILFAINRTLHPGEKRMLEYALKLNKVPEHLKEDINQVFNYEPNQVLQALRRLSKEIEALR